MEAETITVTRQLIHDAMAGRGCLNAKQFAILGIEWPPRVGWAKSSVGKTLTREQAERFVSLKDYSKKAKRAQKSAANPAKSLGHPAIGLKCDSPAEGWWLLRFDGSCDSNGTRDASGKWGFHLQDGRFHTLAVGDGETEAEIVTNNVSEWMAVLMGLKAVASHQIEPPGLLIEGDSQLVIHVLTGRWASKKPELTEFRDECRDLIASLDLRWCARWIPREENDFCDALTRNEPIANHI